MDCRCKSFDWREKTGYNCAIQPETKQTQPQAYAPNPACSNADWSYNEKIVDAPFTKTACARMKSFNLAKFDDMTWEECKDRCVMDCRCKSFDWREKTGYNCAIQPETKQTQPQAYAPNPGCSNADWSYNEKIEG